MTISPVTRERYEEFIVSKPMVVIHVGAEWNQHDDVMSAILNRLELSSDVTIGAISADDKNFGDLFKEVKLINIPALIFYKHGIVVKTHIGLRPQEEFQAMINTLRET